MANHKGDYHDDKQQESDFLETVSQINSGLDKLDSIDSFTPGEQWFEQMVIVEQEKLRKRYLKEMLWFIISAFVILSGVIFTMLEVPVLFLALQGTAVMVAAVYSFRRSQKRVDSQ